MSSLPTFDCYAALEVERNATQKELRDAYRRLVLIHHPDKNLDNEEAATATFRRIQDAYSTLSDPASRERYDSGSSPSPSAAQGQYYRTYFYTDDQSDDDDWYTSDEEYADDFSAEYFEELMRSWREAEEQRRKEREAEAAFRMTRENTEAAIRKARYNAKKTEEEAKIKEREDLRVSEKENQEARWKLFNAVTKDEKLATCLHSEFCNKVPLRQKLKCGACKAKRGITAFECPHCSLYICQQCVSDYTKKRIAEKQAPKKPEPATESEPVVEPKLGVQPESANEPTDKRGSEPNDTGDSKPPNNTFDTKGFKGRAQKKKDKKAVRCFRCHAQGHVAKDCPNRKEGPYSGNKDKKG